MRKHLVKARDCSRGFWLFSAFVVGRIPSHGLRLAWYRHVMRISIGARSSIHWRAAFFAPNKISIGENCIVGNDAFIDGRKGVSIGDNVNLGGQVHIYTLEHDPHARDFGVKGGPVRIENRAYVATRAMILPGVTVGEGAVVAAGAVVTKDVRPFSIVGGVPAREIGGRRRDLDYTLEFRMPFQ